MKFPRKCRIKFCRGLVLKTTHDKICSKCKSRIWKAKNPLKYAFNRLKSGAKKRGISFSLTFDQYTDFAINSGYIYHKGKTAHSLSIDRINSRLGYSANNIRAITISANSSKCRRLAYANIPAWLKDEMKEALAA